MARSKEQIQEETTNRILEALKGGKIPWHRPWRTSLHNGLFFNGATNRAYNGALNQILLNISAMVNGWTDPRWMGYGQARKKGWNVRKGEKSTEIFIPVIKRFRDEDEKLVSYVAGFRSGRVFNAEQIEGIPSLSEQYDIPEVDPEEGFRHAAEVLQNSEASVKHGGDRAAFNYRDDYILMPEAGQFESVPAYWSTLMHELTHWTGHDDRLNRGMFGKGSKKYAEEELVAEMGSAFLCCWLGIEKPEVTQNHEAYIASWIERLENDKSILMDASVSAWKAFKYLTEEE